jgi:hypothetical protein
VVEVPPPSLDEDGNPIVVEDGSNTETKGRRKGKSMISPLITLCLLTMITCLALPLILLYPYFDSSNYNHWKHCIKNYLYSISPEVWQVICDGVDFLKEDEQPTSDQLQKIHCNAQAITNLTSLMDKEEFNRVDGLDEAKVVRTTLRMAHEGSKPMRKAKIDMLEGQLSRFFMFSDETPQDMFNRLKKLVNKAKT